MKANGQKAKHQSARTLIGCLRSETPAVPLITTGDTKENETEIFEVLDVYFYFSGGRSVNIQLYIYLILIKWDIYLTIHVYIF